MVDIVTLVNATNISKAINLLKWMDKDRVARCGEEPARLLDNGPAEPLWLNGDSRYEYQRPDVDTLCELDFLRREIKEGEFVTEIKLTDKADRLVEALYAREADKADLAGHRLDWIVVAHEQVFMDEGATPPNLRALMGEEWNAGDRIVITCHSPEHALVCRLPLALAENDPMFVADLEEVKEDFKYADAEVDAQ
ncbi:MAG: hypothetical protein AABO57_01965 [Acidobacteriota bacterium]